MERMLTWLIVVSKNQAGGRVLRAFFVRGARSPALFMRY